MLLWLATVFFNVFVTFVDKVLTNQHFFWEKNDGVSSENKVSVTDNENINANVNSFSDVPQGHWAYEALDYLAQHGVIEGYKDGTFQGNRTMTRYEMASIVANAMKSDKGDIGDEAVLKSIKRRI